MVTRLASRLSAWYASPTGLVALALLVAAVVLTFTVGSEWGLLALVAVAAIVTPLRVSRLDLAVKDLDRRGRVTANRQEQADAQAKKAAARAKKAGARHRLYARTTAQAARRDAIAAIDGAKHDWSSVLRAERRLADARRDALAADLRSAAEAAESVDVELREATRRLEVTVEALGDHRDLLEAEVEGLRIELVRLRRDREAMLESRVDV